MVESIGLGVYVHVMRKKENKGGKERREGRIRKDKEGQGRKEGRKGAVNEPIGRAT